MSFLSLEEKTVLAQVPRLKFHQGFSKAFFIPLPKGLGRAGLQVSLTHCCICNSAVFFSSLGIPLTTWVPRPNYLKIILTCFLKWLFWSVSCCFGISIIRSHFLPSNKWLEFIYLFIFSFYPGFGEWCSYNGRVWEHAVASAVLWFFRGSPFQPDKSPNTDNGYSLFYKREWVPKAGNNFFTT